MGQAAKQEQPSMQEVQEASDAAQAALEGKGAGGAPASSDLDGAAGDNVVQLTPQQQQERLTKIRETWDAIKDWKQSHKNSNEQLSAYRETLITLGVSREAQRVFAQVERLSADDLQAFALSFNMICAANDKPLQRQLEFAASEE